MGLQPKPLDERGGEAPGAGSRARRLSLRLCSSRSRAEQLGATPHTCTRATEKSVFGLNELTVANLPPTPVLLNLYYGANLINSRS